jgi:hypothetical protein
MPLYILYNIANLFNVIIRLRLDWIPIAYKHLTKILQPSSILEERADVSNHQNDIIVRENIYLSVRTGACTG